MIHVLKLSCMLFILFILFDTVPVLGSVVGLS